MKKLTFILAIVLLAIIAYSCGNSMRSEAVGGEVTGISMMAWDEPTPYGMTLIKRGSLKIGSEEKDSLWGNKNPSREISID
ncbi:MAG: gliding motility-associated lipoprotein GldK, partial [Bacteroidaceae bacterium]